MKRLWQIIRAALLRVGHFLGRINTFVLLSLSFYLILLPLALAWRLFSRRSDPGGWLPRSKLLPDHFKRQF